jgi:hypothetical protein
VRCLSCEIHLLVRVVLRFSREAVVAGRHTKLCNKLMMFNRICSNALKVRVCLIDSEIPHLTAKKMTGAAYIFIIDTHIPNVQKRTIKKFVDGIKELIDPNDLDEGFIEVNECSSVEELTEG